MISGQWYNNDKSAEFIVWNDDYDEYQTNFSKMNMDNDYIYFIKNNTMVRYNLDGNNATKICENQYISKFYLYNNYIYFVNDEDKLCRIDSNGDNEKIIINDCVIYKDKIYYTSNKPDSTELNCVNILDNKLVKIKLPQFYYENGLLKHYDLSFIYNDHAYFSTFSNAGSNTYRIKIDGTNVKEYDMLGDIIGCANNNIFINNNYTEIREFNIDNDDEWDTLYNDINLNIRSDLESYNITNNNEYIVFLYRLPDEDFFTLVVLSIDGNTINEIKVGTEELKDEDYNINILDGYIYLIPKFDETTLFRVRPFGYKLEKISI